MRRRYIYFLLTYFHNSSKKRTHYEIQHKKVQLTALKRPICQARRLPRKF